LDQCDDLRAREEPFVLATVVAYKSPQSAKPGSKAIITADGSSTGWVGGGCVQPIVLREARRALQTGQPKLLTISPDDPRDDWKGVESFRMTCEGGGSLEIYLEHTTRRPAGFQSRCRGHGFQLSQRSNQRIQLRRSRNYG
jgi:xanthine dehydrogenase accessory factor